MEVAEGLAWPPVEVAEGLARPLVEVAEGLARPLVEVAEGLALSLLGHTVGTATAKSSGRVVHQKGFLLPSARPARISSLCRLWDVPM